MEKPQSDRDEFDGLEDSTEDVFGELDTAQRTPRDSLLVTDRYGNRTNLCDLWLNSPAFLVCGGPSLRAVDLRWLQLRGVVSMGVNNVAGLARCSAWTFSDPPHKFHSGIHLDPSCLTFAPIPKLRKKIKVKRQDGSFYYPGQRVRDCPGVFGFKRRCWWTPETFLEGDAASWGNNDNGVEATGRPKLLFSMFLGLRLLHYLGVRRVYMLGVDFGMDPLGDPYQQYAFGQKRDHGACESNNQSYATAREYLAEMRPHFEAAGFQVFNCNPVSRLDVFDYVSFDAAVGDCIRHCAEPFDLEGWYEKDDRPRAERAAEAVQGLSRRERRRLRRIQKNERR